MENVSTEARRDLRVGEQLDQFDLLEQTQCSRVLFIGIFEERSVEAIKPQVALRVVLPVALDAATDPSDNVRDGEEAIRLAQRACELTQMKNIERASFPRLITAVYWS